MTTAAKAAANRLNAQKSTGPRTTDGKNRSRFNAVKHGMTAATVLPGEDPAEFQRMRDDFLCDLRPRNAIEYFLVERAVIVSRQLERSERAENARLAKRAHTAAADQAKREHDEAVDLGARLFWDQRGPLAVYPHDEYLPGGPRVSWSGIPGDPDDPARLLCGLKSTSAGCAWLLDQWAALRDILDRQPAWQAPDRFKVFRLLGKQPLAAIDDPELTRIFLACHLLDPGAGEPFHEVWQELLPEETAFCKRRLEGRNIDRLRPADPAAARQVLVDLVEREIAHLEEITQQHSEAAEIDAQLAVGLVAFDLSPEGERLRRFQLGSMRFVLRVIEGLSKARRSNESAAGVGTAPWNHSIALPSWRNRPSSPFAQPHPLQPAGQPDPTDGDDEPPMLDPDAAPAAEPSTADPQNLENEPTVAAEPLPRAVESPSVEPTPQVEIAASVTANGRDDYAPRDASAHAPAMTVGTPRILQNEATPAIFAGPHHGDRQAPQGRVPGRNNRRDRARRRATANRELFELIDPVAAPTRSPITLAGASLRPKM